MKVPKEGGFMATIDDEIFIFQRKGESNVKFVIRAKKQLDENGEKIKFYEFAPIDLRLEVVF